MKNLKRTVTLVLAIVMMFGIMSIAAPAVAIVTNYSDNEQIQYAEAVEVLSGIGALNGYEDGSFKPTGLVTRAEAAKMVVYSLLGREAAERLVTHDAPFTDVPANHWAAKYIAYCKTQGILNGRGDDSFGPSANITGTELAKMLLVASGRGKMNEYVGAMWDINATTDANTYYIFSATKATDMALPATREECALYTFNMITNTYLVSFEKSNERYVPLYDNPQTTQNEANYTYISSRLGLARESVADSFGRPGRQWKYGLDFISSVYWSKPVLTRSMTTTGRDFGELLKNYSYKTSTSSLVTFNYFVNGELQTYGDLMTKMPVATYEGGQYLGDTMFGIPFVNNGRQVEVYANYLRQISHIVVVDRYVARVTAITAASPYAIADPRAITLTMSVSGANSALPQDQRQEYIITATPKNTVGFDEIYENVQRGDVYLVAPRGGFLSLTQPLDNVLIVPSPTLTATSIEKATEVVGRLAVLGSAFGTTTIKVGEDTYTVATNANVRNLLDNRSKSDADIIRNDFTGEYRFLIEPSGYAIGADVILSGSAVTLNYAFVNEAYYFEGQQADISSGISYKAPAVRLDLTFTDGSRRVVEAPIASNGTIRFPNGSYAADTDDFAGSGYLDGRPGSLANVYLRNRFYSYIVDGNGKYVLNDLLQTGTAVTNAWQLAAGQAVTINNNAIRVNGGSVVSALDGRTLYANASTILKMSDIATGRYSTYTGLANFPKTTVDVDTNVQSVLFVYYTATGALKEVYVIGMEPTGATAQSWQVAMLTGVVSTDEVEPTFSFYHNGATKYYRISPTSVVTKEQLIDMKNAHFLGGIQKLFWVSEYNEQDGTISLESEVSMDSMAGGVVTQLDSVAMSFEPYDMTGTFYPMSGYAYTISKQVGGADIGIPYEPVVALSSDFVVYNVAGYTGAPVTNYMHNDKILTIVDSDGVAFMGFLY